MSWEDYSCPRHYHHHLHHHHYQNNNQDLCEIQISAKDAQLRAAVARIRIHSRTRSTSTNSSHSSALPVDWTSTDPDSNATIHQPRPPQYPYSAHSTFWFVIQILLILFSDISSALTMTEVKIPNHIIRFKSALLGCRYNLDGESLYSVKWYKDGHEFYRYVPRNKPPGQAFPLPGINVDLRNSSDAQVMLRRVTLQSTGVYKCEVSGEAPAFNTVSESEIMTVVMTPQRGPRITGGQTRYQIGDVVRVNCTSYPSKPVCHLSWLINGEPANRSYLKYYDSIVYGRESLEIAILGLEFRVRGYHFKNGDMKLKCVAKISSLYFQSREESVVSDRPQRAPALESRGTVAAKPRAHGSSSMANRFNGLLLDFYNVNFLYLPPLLLLRGRKLFNCKVKFLIVICTVILIALIRLMVLVLVTPRR